MNNEEKAKTEDFLSRSGYFWHLRKGKSKNLSLLLAFLLSVITSTTLFANPQDGTVSAGIATISSSANTLVVNQSSDKAVIDWRSFNINPDEHTQFTQPSSSSITLNRINPANGISNVLGKLTANGLVWLVNPAGVFFGAGAQVNVGGLLATTSNITNKDFMAGNYHFFQDPNWTGSVINEGTITVADNGLVALVAPGVANSGIIQANLGTVVLASGNEFTIDLYGDNLINFQIDSPTKKVGVDENENPLKNAVENSGSIIANGGKVLLTASVAEGVVDHSINMSGFIEAKSAVERNGEIVLSGGDQGIVKVSGTIVASGKSAGQKGGKIKVLGKKVAIIDNASLDASGDQGGGEILIGGNAHGKGEEPNAAYTYFGPNAAANASALTNGDGGKIVLWSDEGTQFYGNILAQGGSQSGNGGWVETSGGNLEFNGLVDTTAANGETGSLLLDPKFIIIQAAGGSAYSNNVNNLFANNATGTSTITAASLATSGANITLQANTDITFNDAVSLTKGGRSLTVRAGRSILINANITTNSGRITLTANDNNSLNATTAANRDSGAGNITMALGTSINAGNQAINLTINPTATSNGVIFTAGDMTLYGLSAGANSTFNAANSVNLNGAFTNSSGTVIINANTSAGEGNVTFNNGGSITTANKAVTINVNTNVASGGTGSIFLNNTTGTDITTGGGALILRTTGGGITNTAGGSITQSGTGNSISTTGGAITLQTPTGGTSSVGTLTQNILTTSNAATFNLRAGSGGAFVSNTGNMTLATPTLNANSPLSVISSGALTLPNGAINTGTGNLILKSNGGVLNLSGALSASSGDITLSASGLLTADQAVTTTGGDITLLGSGVTNSSNNIIINSGSGNILVDSGTVGLTMTSGSKFLSTGNITLTGDAIALNTSGTPSQIGGTGTGVGLASFVLIQPKTAGTVMNIGTGTTGVALTQLETNDVRATNIQIGNSSAGLLTITAWTPVLSFASNGAITLQTGSGGINQTGAINLSTSLSSLIANTAGAFISNEDIITANKSVSLTGMGVSQAPSNDVSTGSGSITINSGTGTLAINGLLSNTGGISLTGDNMTLIGTITAGSGAVNLTSSTLNRAITIGSGATGLGLSNAELNTITTTGILTLGDIAHTGTLSTDSAVTGVTNPSGAWVFQTSGGAITLNNNVTTRNNLTLSTTGAGAAAGAISGTGLLTIGTAGANALTVNAGAGINLNNVGNLANAVTLTNSTAGNIIFNNNRNMTLASVNSAIAGNLTVTNAIGILGTSGAISTATGVGAIYLQTAGALTINNAITANGVGAIRLVSTGGGINLNSSVTADSGIGTTSIVLSGTSFTNIGGALNPGSGRFLVWSAAPSNDTRGGLSYTFKQYNSTFGVTAVQSTTSGNGFLYSVAPVVTPVLTGVVSKVYDTTSVAALLAGNYSNTGAIDGDSITFNNPILGTYDNKNVGTDKNVSISGIAISSATNSGVVVYGYQLGSSIANANIGAIAQAPLTITVTPGQFKTYGANDSSFAYSLAGLLSGDVIAGNLGRLAGENAATSITGYSYSLGGLSAGENYSLNLVTSDKYAINPAFLTIAATASQSKIYGVSDAAGGFGFGNTGLVNGVTPSYWNSSGVYVTGSAINDTITGKLGRVAGENVGSYAYNLGSVAASAPSNYSTSLSASNFTINPATLTIAATASQNKIYGESDAVGGFTYGNTGLVNGVTPSYWNSSGMLVAADTINDTISGNLGRAAGENVGAYAYNLGSVSASTSANYVTNLAASSFTINPASITITANPSQSKTYGENDSVGGFSYSSLGLVNGVTPFYWNSSGMLVADGGSINDTIDGNLGRVAGENVGSYAFTSGNITTNNPSNYITSVEINTFTIIPSSLIVAAVPGQNKTYGVNDPSFSYTNTGLISDVIPKYWNSAGSFVNAAVINDSLSGNVKRATGENVGAYAFNLSNVAVSNPTNYTMSFTPEEFVINPASLIITVSPGQNKTYGVNDPTFAYTQTGLVNAVVDDVTINDSLSGSLSRVLSSATQNAGNYFIDKGTLSVSGAAASNYNVIYNNANKFAISPAGLTIIANPGSKIVGANDPQFTYNVSGLVMGNTASQAVGGALSRGAGQLPGNYAINLGSLASINSNFYISHFDSNTFTIYPNNNVIPIVPDAVATIPSLIYPESLTAAPSNNGNIISINPLVVQEIELERVPAPVGCMSIGANILMCGG